MNLYRGCEHQCIYCDSRSACYGIEDFRNVLVKVNAIELLRKELARKRIKGYIGTGSMSDPYTRAERTYRLTRQALEVIAEFRFPIHMLTKSDMVVEDAERLVDVNRVGALISFTITTTDDDLAARLEPGAPSPSRRLTAMAALASRGISTGVSMMPILPFLEDTEDNIRGIITRARDAGASYIIGGIGMTLRDRQREHFYECLDCHFGGVRERYQRAYGERYEAQPPNAQRLWGLYHELCDQYGLGKGVTPYQPHPPAEQLSLL